MKARFGLILITLLALAGCGPAYEERIEQKYNINILRVEEHGYSGGTVVYQKKNGEICSAAQLANDVLVESGCGEVMKEPS
jgi:hypothetical protein